MIALHALVTGITIALVLLATRLTIELDALDRS